jgi:hypothetical protein
MGSQVKLLTRGEGIIVLSTDKRHFIDFSWGGRNISDFNLIVTFDDMYSKTLYTTFTDNTTKITGLPGQLYWGSDYEPLRISFTLSTDGILADELEDFINYFSPNIERELILTEFPYRGINARVGSTPTMDVVPFQKEIDVNGSIITINEYKGSISLSFVADFPFWHSLPLQSQTFEEASAAEKQAIFDSKLFVSDFLSGDFLEENFSGVIFLDNNRICYVNKDKKEILDSTDGKSLPTGGDIKHYLYNCGTHEAYPVLSFTTTIKKHENGLIVHPASSYTESTSTITIGEEEFFYRLPLALEEYNHALNIVSKYDSKSSLIDLKNEIRDSIKDSQVRKLIIGFINDKNAKIDDVKSNIINIVGEGNISYIFDSKNKTVQSTFSINGVKRTEKAEESIYNNYLTIKERTSFFKDQSDGKYKISTDNLLKVTTSHQLSNFKIEYQYLYR